MNPFKNNLLKCFRSKPFETKFVFALEDEEDDENLQSSELQRQLAGRNAAADQERRRRSVHERVNSINVSEATRQVMKQYLASTDPADVERRDLVERFLRGEEITSEEAFRRALEQYNAEQESWTSIFDVQRTIRRRIQEMQWRIEGYAELAPKGKDKFRQLLTTLHQLNRRDRATDLSMKRLLAGLTRDTETRPSVLSATEAKDIYMSNPVKGYIEGTIKKYSGPIRDAPRGDDILKEIVGLKREERNIEMTFARVERDLERIIYANLDKVRLMAEEEVIVKRASKAAGIRLKPGVVIEYNSNGESVIGTRSPVTIKRVEVEKVPIHDARGKHIATVNGPPIITLGNGSFPNLTMTFGRFKKWADNSDATEKISSLSELEEATDLKPYGVHIKEGMLVSWPVRTRNQQGELATTYQSAKIVEIDNHNNRIKFDSPIPYQLGLTPDVMQTETLDELNFGEFLRWWHRYEVEQSLGLQELREKLLIYNEIENRFLGYEPKDNPPILVQEGEILQYPDETGSTFRIKKLGPDGVSMDGGAKMSFPYFFYWVKNNHVQKKPESKTPEDLAKEAEHEQRAYEIQRTAEEEKKEKLEQGYERLGRAQKDITEREAGSMWSRMKELWHTTQFLSFQDLLKVGHEVMEFVKRRHERRSKGRFGEIGERLGGLIGAEFSRIRESAQDEEVEKYKHAMEKWGVARVKHTLASTNNKDVAKACILTLVHEGEMRWDDHMLWDTLNRLTSRYTLKGAELFIPKPDNMPPGESGEDMARKAIDELWGIGKGSEWYMETISKFNSNKNNFEYKFKQLENDPKGTGGPNGELRKMLKDWRNGKYVNPMEYEAIIDGAIKFGKMTAEQKMFFIIAGVISENPEFHGETLLHIDRIGELNSKWLNNFPMLDYFTQEYVFDPTMYDVDKDVMGKKRKLNITDYREWAKKDFPDDYRDGAAGAQFSKFMWEKMLMSEKVRTRISKGIRHAENMDHDDAHLYIPPCSPTELEQLTSNYQGNQKYFTNSGYANGYAGFSQYYCSLSRSVEQETDEDKRKSGISALRDSMFSFIKYDGILHNRYRKLEGDKRARLDETHFNRSTVVDDGACNLSEHRIQLRNLILDIAEAYGRRDKFAFLWEEPPTGSTSDPVEKEKQQKYEVKLEGLGGVIEDMISEDEGKKALEIIRIARKRADKDAHALRGLPGSKQKE